MIDDEEIPLSQHDLLDSRECEVACNVVKSMADRWFPRSVTKTFFTLGAASYLDAVNERDIYLDRAKVENPMLAESFGWLYERIKRFFERFLNEAVFFDTRYALPGFHVFVMNGTNRSGDNSSSRAHFDLQWMHAIPGHARKGTLSFTLPLQLPSGGSSMDIWHTRYQDAVRLGFAATQYASNHAPQTIPYLLGRLVIHDGLILHAIGGSSVTAPVGHRITLQGHGVQMPEGWLLYW